MAAAMPDIAAARPAMTEHRRFQDSDAARYGCAGRAMEELGAVRGLGLGAPQVLIA